MILKIKEASKIVDLPVATIRYYTDLDMVPSVHRDLEDQRVFDNEAIVWLQGIKFLRELGIPLPEIKEYIQLSQKTGPAALRKRHAFLLKQRDKAQSNILEATNHLEKINKKIQLENDIMAGRKSDSLSAARRFN